MSAEDRLFAGAGAPPRDFVFDERVVRVFPDMIQRSVPGYGLIVPMIGLLARRYARADTRIYDLGCSLGAVSFAVSEAVDAEGIRIVAVDSSEAMIERLRRTLAEAPQPPRVPIQPVCQDIRSVEIVDASVVVLNFTLQFIDPPDRGPLLQRIARGLRPGGILLLSEKIRFESDQEQALQTDWHHDFKRAQGYSELEIARKRDALENVLLPETLDAHRQRLQAAGFQAVHGWFQAFNFVSLLATR